MNNEKIIYYNLTHPQKRIWYIEKIHSNSPLHNIGGCLNIKGEIDFEIFEKAVNIVIEKNPGLRLRFSEISGQPYQYVSEFQEEKIELLDFSTYEDPLMELGKWAEGIYKKTFLLENSSLFCFVMYKVGENKCGLLLSIHHIISDGWSISLMQKQICEVYGNLLKDNNLNSSIEYSYTDYIEKERIYLESDRFIKNKTFWNEKYSDLPETFLYKSSESLEGKRKSFDIDNNKSTKIKNFLNQHRYSLNTFFISIILIYLNKTMQQEDIVIGTPVFNRSGKKDKNTIGMFTSTMPFRLNLNTEFSMEELMHAVNSELKICFFNQKYPYDILIDDLGLNKKGYDSLFKVCVNYYNTKYINQIDGITAGVEEYYSGNQSYSLQLVIKEWQDDNITLSFDYKTSDYTEEDIFDMYKYINNIINQILNNKNEKISKISLLDELEIKEKICTLNSTKCYYPRDKTIYELFEHQVEKTPHKIALSFQGENLTYRELNERSNQLAVYLRKKDVKKEKIVGVMVTHSFEMIVSILGIMKAGAAYLPIDPSYPIERVNYMLQDSGAVMVITNVEITSEIKIKGQILNLNNGEIYLEKTENLNKINDSENLAYIIYTSGSTGKPKGVMIEHSALVNYICWAKKMYLKDEDDIFALYSSISFDLTVTSIFTPLISGNTIAIYYDDGTEFILYKILRENKATVVKLTPSHLTLLKDIENKDSSVRRFIVGGENLKVSLANDIHDRFGGNIEIYNEYGPTETVVGCMIYQYNIAKDMGVSVPIGVPVDNVQVYILDKNFNIVSQGAIGEIYISGDGVARGYINKEDLNKEIFIENPFIKGKRMYKTGDNGKYLSNGNVEYVGRSDNQVKIRGHRIELGEIEKYLQENEFIKDAFVIDRENIIGNKVLYAYLIIEKELDKSELKKWLSRFIPKYMIPTNFIYLEEFPLTSNGKINVALLPECSEIEKEFVKCKTDIEKELVKAMKEVLGVSGISMKDNFYQIGGDSIKAIQISSKLKNLGLDVSIKNILSQDCIEEIAASIEVSSKNKIIDQNISTGNIKKTPIIEWFFQQNFINVHHYNQSVLLESNKALEAYKVEKAVEKLIEHHDALRINYNGEIDELYYNNDYLNEGTNVEHFNLSEYSPYEQHKKIKELGYNLKSNFNIENNTLFKVCIFDLGERGQSILFTAHHLIIDGVSWRILLDDFTTIIEQLNNNEEIVLQLKTHSFMQWSEKLIEYSKSKIKMEERYWESILEKKYCYPVEFDCGQDTMKISSIIYGEVDKETTQELSMKINEMYGMELNEILISALVMTINNITKQKDIVIELERHGREAINDEIDISRTVGWFTSMYPANFMVLDEDLDFNIKSLKEQLRSIPSKGFNFSILKYLNNELNINENKYIRFNYLGDFDNILNNETFKVSDINCGADIGENNNLTCLMDITGMILEKKLKLNITYSKNKFKDETIQKFMDSYIEKLKEILSHCYEKNYKEFTPSDFDAADISQEDLDSLFS
ncbi:non-ribosomal peptide synthetase [Clostridium sp. FP1]|uniref:non-ribosomal peptide synthetase n=1 Tax=Clostridium sp. FP1 TaxID=2724076 RepID=UPI0013E951F0|nr:non-ribosomal peptide synthetase [Clostridium sp. FP1]MBZ9636381.1 amino acid adenylation domain-containing protein [Clostridium sp. FP1]